MIWTGPGWDRRGGYPSSPKPLEKLPRAHSHSNTGTAADEEIAACPTCNPNAKPVHSLARDLMVYWALPLLSRARRCVDALAEGQQIQRDTLAMLGDDIADLIGHSVTDQPPADELAELLIDEPPIRPMVMGDVRLGTRGYFEARRNTKPVDAPRGVCDLRMGHSFAPDVAQRVRMGFDPDGHPPNCPAHDADARAKAVHALGGPGRTSREPAAPVEETPEARARRLDAEREEAGRAYRRAVQAADEAWLAIGGRP